MKKDILFEEFKRKILIEAILIVEENDYMGLLIEKAKIMIKNSGGTFNNEHPFGVFTELNKVLCQLIEYRKLNTALFIDNGLYPGYPKYDKYFKSRIRSAKYVITKLKNFVPD